VPNWCANLLRVSGPAADVRRFRDACRGSAPDWDHTGSGTSQAFSLNALVPVPPDILRAGFDSAGYDWCIAHWGTKWDVDPQADWDDPDAVPLTLFFDTAWTPPLAWLTAVAAQFPMLAFQLVWQEPGGDLGGEALAEQGRCRVDAGDARHPAAVEWFGDPWEDEEADDAD
jgi:hypothetical protein